MPKEEIRIPNRRSCKCFGIYSKKAGNANEKFLSELLHINLRRSLPAALLSLLLAPVMGGCAMPAHDNTHILSDRTAAQNAAAENTAIENTADDYLAVLTDKKTFLYYADGNDTAESVSLSDIPDIFSPYSSYTEIYEFAVVDLDSDGANEVLLQIIDAAGDAGGYLLLRQEKDGVHGYKGNYKAFSDLKTDGTFRYFSSAMPDEGIGTVRFHEKGYGIIPLACSETSENFEATAYQVNQKPASEEEYLAALDQHMSKTDAAWYSFTDENIQVLFSLL